jgi:hypothetical protein
MLRAVRHLDSIAFWLSFRAGKRKDSFRWTALPAPGSLKNKSFLSDYSVS